MYTKLQEKAGYISIETVIIAGVMLLLGIVAINALFFSGKELSANGLGIVDEAILNYAEIDSGAGEGPITPID